MKLIYEECRTEHIEHDLIWLTREGGQCVTGHQLATIQFVCPYSVVCMQIEDTDDAACECQIRILLGARKLLFDTDFHAKMFARVLNKFEICWKIEEKKRYKKKQTRTNLAWLEGTEF